MTTEHTNPLAKLAAELREPFLKTNTSKGDAEYRTKLAERKWIADRLETAIAEMCDVALERCAPNPHTPPDTDTVCVAHYKGSLRAHGVEPKFTQQEASDG